jgi:ABC-type sugar transport system substrate-binding protein
MLMADVEYGVGTDYLSAEVNHVAKAGQAAGLQVIDANPNGDAPTQANDILTMVSRGVKGILVNAVNSTAVLPAISQAMARGVKVVPYDGNVAGGPQPVEVSTDNYGAGADACRVLGTALHGQGTVLNLQGTLTNQAGLDRSNGFTDCMAKNYPQMKVISKAFNFDAGQCAQVAQTVLTTTKIDGIYSAAAQCYGPVSTVLKSLHRLIPIGHPGHVALTEIDGVPEDLNAVRQGYMDASISQPMTQIAQDAVYWLLQEIHGQAIHAGPTSHGTLVERGGTLHDYIPPVVVTRQNVNDPSLWANQT